VFSTGTNYTRADFRRARLLGLYTMDSTNFSFANFAGVRLNPVDARDAKFVGADLSGGLEGKFKSFEGTDFSRANLAHADFTFADLVRTRFDGASLRGATLDEPNLSGASSFRNADLRGATIRANFALIDLRGANFAGAKILMPGTSWLGAKFGHTTCPDGQVTDTGC
jgi:uncharacterized protein YjbI with pentapeptide repeats